MNDMIYLIIYLNRYDITLLIFIFSCHGMAIDNSWSR